MKRLTIIRHAKSDWTDSNLSDHDRPLNARGLGAAPAIGEALAAKGFQPDLILSSTAERAKTTAGFVAEKLGYPREKIVELHDLYHASRGDLERITAAIDDEAEIGHAMIFAHNPGLEDYLDHLLGRYAERRFVTCAVADLELDIEFWGQVGVGCGTLSSFLSPADLDR
jgi:phosphohistidine phosphatase